jgi:uncharacterized protein
MKKHMVGNIDFIELPSGSISALGKTRAFFASALGWTFQDWGDDYADVLGAGLGCGINADLEHRPPQPLVVIYTDDLERMRRKIVDAGGEIVRDTFTFPGGRRFHFREPSGNVLAIWSDK